MATSASLDLARPALAAPRHSLRTRPSCRCLQPPNGHTKPAGPALSHSPRPTARAPVRTAAAGPSESGAGEPARPGKRVLTNEERATLGLPPLKNPAPSQAEAQAPPGPMPTSTPTTSSSRSASTSSTSPTSSRSSTPSSRTGLPRGGPTRKDWTLLDQMDSDGFGYMAPSDNEWPLIKTARRWGEWLKEATGEDDEARSTAMGTGIMKVMLLVVFPTWMLLVLVAVGRLNLPPALLEFQEALRS